MLNKEEFVQYRDEQVERKQCADRIAHERLAEVTCVTDEANGILEEFGVSKRLSPHNENFISVQWISGLGREVSGIYMHRCDDRWKLCIGPRDVYGTLEDVISAAIKHLIKESIGA
jgi:hypothetical protein